MSVARLRASVFEEVQCDKSTCVDEQGSDTHMSVVKFYCETRVAVMNVQHAISVQHSPGSMYIIKMHRCSWRTGSYSYVV